MVARDFGLPIQAIHDFCRRWEIDKLEIFGSRLREDFTPESDLDFLATFRLEAQWSLFDVIAAEEELSGIVGRRVDLVERPAVEQSENWIRRNAILKSARCVYVA